MAGAEEVHGGVYPRPRLVRFGRGVPSQIFLWSALSMLNKPTRDSATPFLANQALRRFGPG
jgi:hypothetical protein